MYYSVHLKKPEKYGNMHEIMLGVYPGCRYVEFFIPKTVALTGIYLVCNMGRLERP